MAAMAIIEECSKTVGNREVHSFEFYILWYRLDIFRY